MNMRSTMFCSLLLVSSVALAGPFPSASRQNGMQMYRTGQPVPAQYMADNNVIHNYHHYHLDKPTDGYEWVHGVENEYLLISAKSGILRRIETRPSIPRDPSEGPAPQGQ
ncbi:RcnB family protein [Dyella acidiphila]|uniref:RcnB family protein n=1 Tax=Dyella acidiphila TaxID=2775866 RepID=A0ABR9GBH7_9GAMM|nr:RcnB family protein [Dyella acidiphila]MBE1161386.1 RcnB family protein [Dyella acidiphila]